MTKTNTLSTARSLADAVSAKEGVTVSISQYVGNRSIINNGGNMQIDVRDNRIFFAYGITTPTKFYSFSSRAAQCEWLRDRL